MQEVVDMMEYIVNCPCCNNKMRISIDDSGNATAFLLEEKEISQDELFQNFGIELGITGSEVKKCEC